ncbi:MAG: hypothetical protein AAGK21_04200 [Bacteroidota bacterium]
MTEGPPLERLTRRLQACPDALLHPESVDVPAVLADVLRDLAGDPLRRVGTPMLPAGASPRTTGVALVTAWLLADESFRGLVSPDAARQLIARDLDALAAVVSAEDCVTDAGRREELARFVLAALDLRPAGETDAQAADRLATLDSAARLAIVRETHAAEERARQIREAMARRAREEAAAKAMRE